MENIMGRFFMTVVNFRDISTSQQPNKKLGNFSRLKYLSFIFLKKTTKKHTKKPIYVAWLCDSRVRVVIIAPFSFHDNTLYKLGIFFRGRFVSLSYGVGHDFRRCF